ncbi:MAG: hypothetical protein R3B67_13565 [Phycisphaerales bacterium]
MPRCSSGRPASTPWWGSSIASTSSRSRPRRQVPLPAKPSEEVPKYWINANALTSADAKGLNTVGLTVSGKDGKGIGYYESDNARLRLTPRHYAYLRISEGCNQNCAFCTIPSIRGKMRSKPEDRIIEEAREPGRQRLRTPHDRAGHHKLRRRHRRRARTSPRRR